jgi:hypothetical protein
MKIAVILFLASFYVAPASMAFLDDLATFKYTVQWEAFKNILADYAVNDEQTVVAVQLMKSSQFINFYKLFIATTEFINATNFLYGAGVPVLPRINQFHTYLGLSAYVPKKVTSKLSD